MYHHLTHSRLANLGAQTMHGAFDAYQAEFMDITRRAKARFEQRAWRELRDDATERLDLYRQVVDPTVADIRALLGDRIYDKFVWTGMKAVYSGLIAERDDWELAETFFNSITRRIFTTVGVDATIEFVDTDFDTPPTEASQLIYRVYRQSDSIIELVQTILDDYHHRTPYEDGDRDAQLVAAEVEARLSSLGLPPFIDRVDMALPIFYRNKGAYLIGRLHCGGRCVPLGIALMNPPQGVVVDAVLLDEDAISIIFSFAYSYFHVSVERPYDLVYFLKSLMPRKRVAELYIALGYHKHGKTELYRDLLNSLASSHDRFERAPGERGMVMLVFTLPSYDLVVKIIKDRFDEPKNTTRQAVMQKYHLVFRHDRAGRLVDAQEFEYLRFERSRFSQELLEELQQAAAQMVSVADDWVIIKHAYLERRVTPLNMYLRQAEEPAARAAAVDYGNAIKDLAASNIFPGDLLLKNFGVTRHGRVVFYDYDELCLLTDCQFSEMPQAQDDDEELAGEPWFHVRENQVFPEEFRSFLKLPGDLNEVFVRHHADLFELRFWWQLQERLRAGEVVDIFPYARSQRLSAKWPNGTDGKC